MARRVKCIDTGNYSMSDIAFAVQQKDSSGKIVNKYYSSEDGFNKYTENVEYRKKCIDQMYVYMNYDYCQTMPTIFYKKLKEIEQFGYKIVHETMLSCHDSICWSIENKNFDSDIYKINYICAIIKNHINDVYLKSKREVTVQKQIQQRDDFSEDFIEADRGKADVASEILGEI